MDLHYLIDNLTNQHYYFSF